MNELNKQEHCWHGTGHNIGEDREEVCCNCGLTYDPGKLTPRSGHGPFSPNHERVLPLKPKGPCKLATQEVKKEKV